MIYWPCIATSSRRWRRPLPESDAAPQRVGRARAGRPEGGSAAVAGLAIFTLCASRSVASYRRHSAPGRITSACALCVTTASVQLPVPREIQPAIVAERPQKEKIFLPRPDPDIAWPPLAEIIFTSSSAASRNSFFKLHARI